jgi:VanZ family protein
MSHAEAFLPGHTTIMIHSPTPLRRAVFWLGVLTVVTLSLIPGDQLPSVFAWWDKAQHALGFALLTALGLLAYGRSRWYVPAGLLLLGALIEVAQAASGWRTGDWKDLLADAIGILVAMLLWATTLGRNAA